MFLRDRSQNKIVIIFVSCNWIIFSQISRMELGSTICSFSLHSK